jgi:SAM-dependent methyltransferase
MANEEQIEYWNGDAGKRWADCDALMERILSPITAALLEHADLGGCRTALDVGCGGGSQSVQLARRLGPGSSVTGIDISAPMLEVAREKAGASGPDCGNLEFVQADASSFTFEPRSFDLLFSRFGVMFFDDPRAAFANMATALRPGARVAFACWRGLRDNDWAWLPLQTALKHVPPPEPPDPHAPGPFAFADEARVTDILSGAGLTNIDMQKHATTMVFGNDSTLEEAVTNLARIGPLSRLLAEQPGEVEGRVIAELGIDLQSYFSDGALRLPGSVWFVTARNAA